MDIKIGDYVERQPEPGTFTITLMTYEGDMDSPNSEVMINLTHDEVLREYEILNCIKDHSDKIDSLNDIAYVLTEYIDIETLMEWWNEDDYSEGDISSAKELHDQSDYVSEWAGDLFGYGEYGARWIDRITVRYIDIDRRLREVTIG